MSVFHHLQALAREATAAADLARGEQDAGSLAALLSRLACISEQAGLARRAALLDLGSCAGEQPAYVAAARGQGGA